MNAKKLKNLIPLRHNIKLFVPSTINVSEETNNEEMVDRVASAFSEMFGGSTTYKAMGCWQSPVAGLVKEKVVIVEAFCSEKQLEKHVDNVIELAEVVRSNMEQEAVAVQINNELYFV